MQKFSPQLLTNALEQKLVFAQVKLSWVLSQKDL